MTNERAKELFNIALGLPMEDDNDGPVLFEDEIAEILATCGAGAKVLIYDLFPDATAYTYSGTYDKELTWKIYDALEEGLPVTINGKDITTM